MASAMTGKKSGFVTGLLQRWRRGDESALEELAQIVNQELRHLAAAYLRRERQEHTLQPTALVNELYLRLLREKGGVDWESRVHFMAIAARHMRQILVDYARRRGASKRGVGIAKIPLNDSLAAADEAPLLDLLALNQALERLAQMSPRKSQVMELKYFGGLQLAEIASVLEVSVKTVEKDMRIASAWIRAAMNGEL